MEMKDIATFVLVTALILISVGGIQSFNILTSGQTQAFSLTGTAVYEPEFASLRCQKTDRVVTDLYYYVTGDPKSPTTYVRDAQGKDLKVIKGNVNIECSRGIDKVFTNQCQVKVKVNPDNLATTFGNKDYKCPVDAPNLLSCQDITGSLGGQFNVWNDIDTITRNEMIVLTDFKKSLFGFNREIVDGEIVYRVSRDEYGLVNYVGGRIEVHNSCDLKDILRMSEKDILKLEWNKVNNQGNIIGTRLDFGATINYVIGFRPLLESKRIIDNGKFYTYGAGFKYPITEGESGRKYVDLTTKITDNTIICDPASLYCINDGRTIDVQFDAGGECNPATDVIDGWVPYTQQNNWIAQRQCVGGKWIELNPKPIPTCSGVTPVLNQDYVCVAGTERESTQKGETDNFLPFYLLGMGIVMLGIARVLRRK